MAKKRHLLRNKDGYSSVLETLISIGISITLLIVFFYSANTLYDVQDNPESNLESKAMGVMETLTTSTGQDASQSSEWQDYALFESLGLGTNPTVEYGVVTINATTKKSTIHVSYRFDPNEYGFESTCFLAGTKVVMADGSYKNIEDIVVGDMVKCYDQMKREVVERIVTNVFHHNPEEMEEYYLIINDQLRVTPNHLIYSDGGWIEASNLKIGDNLFYPSTDYPIVSINKVFDRVETFDIEVEGFHNFFVAMSDVDALVHNYYKKPSYGCDAGPSVGGKPGILVSFDGDVWGGDTPYSYSWDFDHRDGTNQVDSILEDPSWSYTEEGLYIVTLKVTESGEGKVATDTTTAAISTKPVARFEWFDKDGLGSGDTVFFDAGKSSGGSLEYRWDWYSNGTYEVDPDPPYIENSDDFESGKKYNVTLEVSNAQGSDTVTHTVEVNSIVPDYNMRPWILTGKDVLPEEDFSTVGEDYYITYRPIGATADMYTYEVKRVTSTVKPILDIRKIYAINLAPIKTYELAKSALGLDEEFDGGFINFNISVDIKGHIGHTESIYFGPSEPQNVIAKEVTSRRVLIYDGPEGDASGIIARHPAYYHGEITVRIFLGGTI